MTSLNFQVSHHSNIHFDDDVENGIFASDDPPNLIFIKIPKAASSTTGGVARRIAARHGLGCVQDSVCEWKEEPSVSAHHIRRSKFEGEGISLTKPIVWMTSLRDPLSRCMSMYYHFRVGRKGVSDTAEDKLQYLKSAECRNYQWKYMCPPSICRSNDVPTAEALDAYNFTVLADRFDESMALLIRTLGLSVSDALYLEAKDSSAFDNPHPRFEEEPAEVQEFGRSDEFKAQNDRDYELWNIVNDRMDVQMRQPKNIKTYETYKQLLEKATSTCKSNCSWDVDKNTGYGCEDCYWHDNGCGYTCFDSM